MASINEINHELDGISVSSSFTCTPDKCADYLKSSQALNVLHLNIRSLNKNFNELSCLLASIEIKCDILILTECWLKRNAAVPSIQGYTSCQSINLINQNDGVVMYINEKLDFSITEPKFSGASCLVCAIENNFTIIALYRPPSQKNIDNFLDSLDKLLTDCSQCKNVSIIGDININIAPGSHDPHFCQYLNLVASHGILPAHVLPTRLENCLDHVMLRTICDAITLVVETSITDHSAVLLNIGIKPPNRCSDRCTAPRLNLPCAVTDIESCDFSIVSKIFDPNLAMDKLYEILTPIVIKNTVYKTIPSKHKIIKPWITVGLLRCIRNRDNMHKRTNKEPQNTIVKLTYLRYRNFCNNLLKKLKAAYESQAYSDAKNNPKKMWAAVRNVLDTNKNTLPPTNLLKITGDPDVSVNTVNRFFADVGRNLANNIPKNLSGAQCISPHPVPMVNSIALLEADEEQVDALIKNLTQCLWLGWHLS